MTVRPRAIVQQPERTLSRSELLEQLFSTFVTDVVSALEQRAEPAKPEKLFWNVKETAERIGGGFGQNRVRELARAGAFAYTRKDPGNPDSEMLIDPDSVVAWKHNLIFPDAAA